MLDNMREFVGKQSAAHRSLRRKLALSKHDVIPERVRECIEITSCVCSLLAGVNASLGEGPAELNFKGAKDRRIERPSARWDQRASRRPFLRRRCAAKTWRCSRPPGTRTRTHRYSLSSFLRLTFELCCGDRRMEMQMRAPGFTRSTARAAPATRAHHAPRRLTYGSSPRPSL